MTEHRHHLERVGTGRWTPVRSPAGMLWTDDQSVVGFQPGPMSDAAAVDLLIDTVEGTPTEVFDELSLRIGTTVIAGDLATWRAR